MNDQTVNLANYRVQVISSLHQEANSRLVEAMAANAAMARDLEAKDKRIAELEAKIEDKNEKATS